MKFNNMLGNVLFSALFFAISNVSYAGTITLNATGSGWYRDTGLHNVSGEPNIFTGVCTTCSYTSEARNFFLFDLSSINETIISAELRFSTANTTGSFGSLVTDDPYETYTLFDITSDLAILPVGDPGNTALFDDLADGTVYGSYNFSSPLDLFISLNLSAAAINDLNNATGLFGMGGAITTLDNDFTRSQFLFGGTHTGVQTRELILTTIPVPAAAWLFLSGMMLMAGMVRRAR